MKVLVQRIYDNPKYAKTLEWGKLITITGGAQVVVQALGFVCGIMSVRLLSTQEYALFTLANTMLGTMTILADSGITNGVMAESGKVWQDKEKLGSILATGLDMRKKFGLLSLAVSLPVLAYLLFMHGASWLTLVLILTAIVLTFYAALSDSILEVVPRLHQDIKPLQRNQIEVGVGRLLLTGSFLFAFPYTFVALLANGIPRIYGNYKLKGLSIRFAAEHKIPDPEVRKAVVRGVKRTLPIVMYHCISGQISIWLISFFGTTTSISQIGALGRLSMAFSLFTVLFSTLVVPRFSRMAASKAGLLRHFLLAQASALLISFILMIGIWLFSNQILWLLGKNYQGLNHELLLVGTFNCLGLVGGICSQLMLSRGWFLKPYFVIGLNFISTIISIAFFNISSLVGILNFNIAVSTIAYFIEFTYGIISINRVERTD
jgi:O-antigen/teichoic acid export membrane protein